MIAPIKVTLLEEKAKYIFDISLHCKTLQVQDKVTHQCIRMLKLSSDGDLVYLYVSFISKLQKETIKLHQDSLGPFVIKAVLDSTHYVSRAIENRVLVDMVSINRLKLCFVPTQSGTVMTPVS